MPTCHLLIYCVHVQRFAERLNERTSSSIVQVRSTERTWNSMKISLRVVGASSVPHFHLPHILIDGIYLPRCFSPPSEEKDQQPQSQVRHWNSGHPAMAACPAPSVSQLQSALYARRAVRLPITTPSTSPGPPKAGCSRHRPS